MSKYGDDGIKIAQEFGDDVAKQVDDILKKSLDDAVVYAKTIRFSHDPTLPENMLSSLGDEWDYLQSTHGYVDVIKKGEYWYAVK